MSCSRKHNKRQDFMTNWVVSMAKSTGWKVFKANILGVQVIPKLLPAGGSERQPIESASTRAGYPSGAPPAASAASIPGDEARFVKFPSQGAVERHSEAPHASSVDEARSVHLPDQDALKHYPEAPHPHVVPADAVQAIPHILQKAVDSFASHPGHANPAGAPHPIPADVLHAVHPRHTAPDQSERPREVPAHDMHAVSRYDQHNAPGHHTPVGSQSTPPMHDRPHQDQEPGRGH